jgi:hypothetical protein
MLFESFHCTAYWNYKLTQRHRGYSEVQSFKGNHEVNLTAPIKQTNSMVTSTLMIVSSIRSANQSCSGAIPWSGVVLSCLQCIAINTPKMITRLPVFGTKHMKMIWRRYESDMKTTSSSDSARSRVIVDLSVDPKNKAPLITRPRDKLAVSAAYLVLKAEEIKPSRYSSSLLLTSVQNCELHPFHTSDTGWLRSPDLYTRYPITLILGR